MTQHRFTFKSCLDKWQQTLWISAQNEIKDKIRELHKPQKFADLTVCKHCWTISEQNVTIGTNGFHYKYIYPCPTIELLEES